MVEIHKDPNDEKTNNQGYLTQLHSYPCTNNNRSNVSATLADFKQFAKITKTKSHYNKT